MISDPKNSYNGITDSNNSSQQLQEGDHKWRFALEGNGDGIWDWNVRTNKVTFSPMCKKMLGYARKHDMSHNVDEWNQWIHPHDREGAVIAMDLHLAGKSPSYSSQHRMLCKDGTYKWVLDRAKIFQYSEDGQPLRVIGTYSDITNTKLAETALKEGEELYRNLIDLSPDPIIILQHGRFQLINSKFSQLFGYTLQDMQQGLNFFDLVPAEEKDKVLKRYQDRLAGKQLQDMFSFHMMAKNGTAIPCETSATAIHHKGELAILVIIRDITQRRQAEENRVKLESQLVHSRKMEAIGTLSGGIAHDFNNLLTVINGHAEMALMRTHSNCPVEKDVRAIMNAGRRAENLTRQLLAFSRKQVIKPEIIDVNGVIRGLDKMMHRLMGEDLRIEFTFSDDLPHIKGDPGQIEQILINLIVNGRDAIAARVNCAAACERVEKTIAVETQQVVLEQEYVDRHPGTVTGLHVMLKVSDNGIGMDAETKDKIFEPFFTTKDKGKGTGLGMATVYGIVKQNKGSIYVYSEPGLGTSFSIYWPATDEERQPKIEKISVREHLAGSETVLVVEDDAAVRNFAGESLADLGYKVFEASNGDEALAIVKGKKIAIDLLFTDVVMPGMNGMELAMEIQTLMPQCKVLFASGYTSNYIVDNGALKEGLQFIQKPYSACDIARKIRLTLDTLHACLN